MIHAAPKLYRNLTFRVSSNTWISPRLNKPKQTLTRKDLLKFDDFKVGWNAIVDSFHKIVSLPLGPSTTPGQWLKSLDSAIQTHKTGGQTTTNATMDHGKSQIDKDC